MVVYLGIVAIVLAVTVTLAVQLLESDARGDTRAVVDRGAARLLARLGETMYAATAIDAAGSTFGADSGQLTLAMRDAARSPAVFSLSGGRVEVREGAGGTAITLTPASAEVTRFHFTRLNPAGAREAVRVELTIRFRNTSGDPAYDYTQTYQSGFTLR